MTCPKTCHGEEPDSTTNANSAPVVQLLWAVWGLSKSCQGQISLKQQTKHRWKASPKSDVRDDNKNQKKKTIPFLSSKNIKPIRLQCSPRLSPFATYQHPHLSPRFAGRRVFGIRFRGILPLELVQLSRHHSSSPSNRSACARLERPDTASHALNGP